MDTDRVISCASCGSEISPKVPEYFIEIESFRLMNERGEQIPRRGSHEYHEMMERLAPEIHEAYFHNQELYDGNHLWCPSCGCRLVRPE